MIQEMRRVAKKGTDSEMNAKVGVTSVAAASDLGRKCRMWLRAENPLRNPTRSAMKIRMLQPARRPSEPKKMVRRVEGFSGRIGLEGRDTSLGCVESSWNSFKMAFLGSLKRIRRCEAGSSAVLWS